MHSLDRTRWSSALVPLAVLFFVVAAHFGASAQQLHPVVMSQMRSLQQEKAARSPRELKMDSQFVYALKRSRNQQIAFGVTTLQPAVKYQADGRILVDLHARVTPDLLEAIRKGGGFVTGSFPRFDSVRALVPLTLIETIVDRTEVKFVRPAAEAFTNAGAVTSQGDTTHGANTARTTFNVNGSGVKVGVLSDSEDHLTDSQAAGELGTVTVLPGQSGEQRTGEGTAMLEIVHDLAPGAQLFFATAFNGEASFAQNILDLRAAGCNIIIDDVNYFDESPFQDGIIARAVNQVTADGALYFSAAGNSGSKTAGTSGTWEGDFADGGAAPTLVSGKGGRIHSFGASTFNTIASGGSSRRVDLFWADPLGASTNDYDVYVLNSTGSSIVASSTNPQTGTQDPYESINSINVGQRIVIVKASGAARFLHLSTGRAVLSNSTSGSTAGHAAATNAICVAAVSAGTSYPNPFSGGSTNPTETFSSDGPRHVFFQADGTPITPGNFLASGGTVRQKPDIAAADGVSTSVTGFSSFFGTSAAAPHAGAIAALLLSYNPALTPTQIRNILTSSALDIRASGVDRDSGAGLVMAASAIQTAPLPTPRLIVDSWSISGGNGNGTVDPNECNNLSIAIKNYTGPGSPAATAVVASLSTPTPGVLITQNTSQYLSVAANATRTNLAPFQISTAPGFVCGTPIQIVMVITTGNAGNFTNTFLIPSGTPATPIDFVSADLPKSIQDFVTVDSTNTVTGITAPVGKVTVSLHLTHTYDGDMVISLVAPDGTSTYLTANDGGDGRDFGTSCSAQTVFDDSASTIISSGSAPFIGSFRPHGSLAVFNGMSAAVANGVWKLRISDIGPGDVGDLLCWTLSIAPLTCTDGGGSCPNQPPILLVPPDQTISESSTMTVTNVASDVESPAGSLTFGLANPPAGMTINPATGVITWTPTESQAPSTNSIFVVVSDNGTPNLSVTNAFTVIVTEVNSPPLLKVPADQIIAELATLTVTNLANDPDLPANALAFALVSAPSGVTIDSVTGVLTWTPSEAQGPSTNLITIKVTDDGTPPLSTTNGFTVVVTEVNLAPALVVPATQTIAEQTTIVVTNLGTDSDLPANALTFSLVGAPTGASIDSATGVVTWTPSAGLSPSTNAFTVVLTDNGTPNLSTTNSFNVIVVPPAQIVGRYLFYNQSKFDGDDSTANAADDNAIAPDKIALLPGQVAAFTNVSSYSRGINGIMVDIAGLPGTPSAADFEFKIGNDNNPSGWSTGASPASVTTRTGAGTNGSSRVTLIWTNNAIQKTWLQVRVLSTAATGLTSADRFYFGNAIGEAGNSSVDLKVDLLDQQLPRVNPHTALNPAAIDFPYDYNRDQKVDLLDQAIARVNPTTALNALRLIDLTASTGNSSVSRLSLASPLMSAANPAGKLKISVLDATRVLIEFQSDNGMTPQLESTEDWNESQWNRVESNVSVSEFGTLYQWTIPTSQSIHRFFRVTTGK